LVTLGRLTDGWAFSVAKPSTRAMVMPHGYVRRSDSACPGVPMGVLVNP
jgi:hypothetical protein